MAPGSKLPLLLRPFVKLSHPRAPLLDAAENQLAPLDIDLLGCEPSIEPDLRHHVVPRIVAPPRTIALGEPQFAPDDPLDLRERHTHFGTALLSQVISKGGVFCHERSRVCVFNLHTHYLTAHGGQP